MFFPLYVYLLSLRPPYYILTIIRIKKEIDHLVFNLLIFSWNNYYLRLPSSPFYLTLPFSLLFT